MGIQQTIIRSSDKIMAFAFYALIYFLPISSAITESLFGLILFCYFIKRGTVLYSHLKDNKNDAVTEKNIFRFWRVTRTFLRAYKPVDTYLNKPIGIFILVGFLTIFVSHYPMLSVKGFFFKLLQGTFTYFLFVESINSPKRLRDFMIVFFISMTLIVSNGIFQYFTREGIIHHHIITDGRVTSSFNHANNFGGYLVFILPLLISLSLLFKVQIKQTMQVASNAFSMFGSFVTRKLQVFISFLTIGSLVCLGLTFSRGSWLAFLICLILLGLHRRRFFIFIALFIMLFFVIFSSQLVTESRFSKERFWGSSERISYWQESIDIIKDYPILGVGLNTYSLVAPKYKINWGGYPHNCYLQTAAEMGLVGLIAFLWILFRIFRNVGQSMKIVKNSVLSNLLLGTTIGFGGYLFHSFFDTNFYSVQLGNLLWLAMGLIVVVEKFAIMPEEALSDQSVSIFKEVYNFMLAKRNILLILLIIAIFALISDYHAKRLSYLEEKFEFLDSIPPRLSSVESGLMGIEEINSRLDRLEYRSQIISSLDTKISYIGSRLDRVEHRSQVIGGLDTKISYFESRLGRLEHKSQIVGGLDEEISNLESKVDKVNGFETPTLTEGLLAHYKCDKNGVAVIENISNGLHASEMRESLEAIATKDDDGCAFNFDGINTCIAIDHLQQNVAHDAIGTISLWMKNVDSGVVFSLNDTDADRHFIIMNDFKTLTQQYFGFEGSHGRNTWFSYISDNRFNEQQWLHLAVVQDGISLKAYLNGQRVEIIDYYENVAPGAWFVDYDNLDNGRLGCSDFAGRGTQHGYKGYEGLMNHFRYYRRALLPFEIEKIYTEEVSTFH